MITVYELSSGPAGRSRGAPVVLHSHSSTLKATSTLKRESQWSYDASLAAGRNALYNSGKNFGKTGERGRPSDKHRKSPGIVRVEASKQPKGGKTGGSSSLEALGASTTDGLSAGAAAPAPAMDADDIIDDEPLPDLNASAEAAAADVAGVADEVDEDLEAAAAPAAEEGGEGGGEGEQPGMDTGEEVRPGSTVTFEADAGGLDSLVPPLVLPAAEVEEEELDDEPLPTLEKYAAKRIKDIDELSTESEADDDDDQQALRPPSVWGTAADGRRFRVEAGLGRPKEGAERATGRGAGPTEDQLVFDMWFDDETARQHATVPDLSGLPGHAAHRPVTRSHLIGDHSRTEFFDRYRERHAETNEDPSNAQRIDSARSKYIDTCDREGLAPLPLLTQAFESTTVNLAGRRLGDKMLKVYLDAMARLLNQGVRIERLLFSENASTDSGCAPFSMALVYLPELEHLDLSQNPLSAAVCAKLGPAISAHIALHELVLSHCKLSDTAASHIISAISDQGEIKILDLQGNSIGGTGTHLAAKALQKLLSWSRCQLRELHLGWNLFLAPHVKDLANSLATNTSLELFDLSWNSICDAGAMALAHSLRSNTRLQVLKLQHAEIWERGTMVLADALIENRTLKVVELQENPIGNRGGRAVLRAISYNMRFGWDREVNISRCNYDILEESESLFSRDEGAGSYSLELDDPYDRMVAWQLYDMEMYQEGENWENEALDGSPFNLTELVPESGQQPGVTLTREEFSLPDSGQLTLRFKMTPFIPRFRHSIRSSMVNRLVCMMRDREVVDGGLKLLQLAAKEFFFVAEYASILVQLMPDSVSKIEAASCLLGRIVDDTNIPSQLFNFLSAREMNGIEAKVPSLFKFVPTNPTGHYKLYLANPTDRQVARMLCAFDQDERADRAAHELIDTSQHQRVSAETGKPVYCNWRNEHFEHFGDGESDWSWQDQKNGEGANRKPMPKYGVLELDYVSTNTVHRRVGAPPMPDEIFAWMLQDLRAQWKLVLLESSEDGGEKANPFAEPDLDAERMERSAVTIQAHGRGFVARRKTARHRLGLASLTAIHERMAALTAVQIGHFEEQQIKQSSRINASKLSVHAKTVEEAAAEQAAAIERVAGAAADTRRQWRRQTVDRRSRAFLIGHKSVQKALAHRHNRNRPSWWIPNEGVITAESEEEREEEVADRMVRMLRRASLEHFFTADQFFQLLKTVPHVHHNKGRIEAIVTMWGRLLDGENIDFSDLCEQHGYDQNDDGFVMFYELFEQKVLDKCQPAAVLTQRLGSANMFNPMKPERKMYVLDMVQADDLKVARMLLELAKLEKGENIIKETYNGVPIDFNEDANLDGLVQKQALEFTTRGILSFCFATEPGGANVHRRATLAQALLLPGPGRWRCIDRSLWLEEATEDELQELDDESQWTAVRNEGWAIHADGSLVKQIDPNHLEVQSARWLGGIIGVDETLHASELAKLQLLASGAPARPPAE